jgi:hypothetical protein
MSSQRVWQWTDFFPDEGASSTSPSSSRLATAEELIGALDDVRTVCKTRH